MAAAGGTSRRGDPGGLGALRTWQGFWSLGWYPATLQNADILLLGVGQPKWQLREAMAFPALRHALVAVALCRVVEGCECWGWWTCTCSWNFCTCAAPAPAPAPAPRPASGPAHDDSKCYEWGYPKEGKWQHDEDCCAGVEQAACAAGHRYVKGEMCHKEVECKAFSYECELCQPGET